jgi:hypothetical protein
LRKPRAIDFAAPFSAQGLLDISAQLAGSPDREHRGVNIELFWVDQNTLGPYH